MLLAALALPAVCLCSPAGQSRSAPTQSALSLFAKGIKELEGKRCEEALRCLKQVQPKLPKLADYVAYSLASAHFQLKNHAEALKQLETVFNHEVLSPHRGRAALLAARAQRERGAPREAVEILRRYYNDLPQPEGEFLLASCQEAAGDLAAAAASYQRVYYQYPGSDEAEKARSELERLRSVLGPAYPAPDPQAMLERAALWIRMGQYRRAKSEYEALARQLNGPERDFARVRIGAAQYFDYETLSAYTYLKSLTTSYPEAEAERLYYLVECTRRLDKDEEMRAYLNRLTQSHPRSPWRLKALISVANYYLVQNRTELYEPLYRACADDFPDDPQAAYCHWKVAWAIHMRRRPEAAEWFRNHLVKFPGSEKASAALYFLGRLAEGSGDFAAAKTYYEEALERFPSHYYSILSEGRLARPEFLRVVRSESVAAFLDRVVWPVRVYPDKFAPDAVTKLRLERFRLLVSASLEELAEQELRFGVKVDRQPHILGLELARHASRNSPPHQVLRLLKSAVPSYLSFPLDDAPVQFWKFLFPLPYWSSLARYAKQHNLDPFLVAGLVRQESEFNPGAVSPARAYGLTQILPSNGRQLMRKLGVRSYRTSHLFRPDTNLRLGTYYLKTLLEKHGGRLELALAAYNAGPQRVQLWQSWGDFREPAEFIETIPFTETRAYVVAVLRNAEIYRRLYGDGKELRLAAEAPKVTSSSGKGFKRAPVLKKKSRPRKSR